MAKRKPRQTARKDTHHTLAIVGFAAVVILALGAFAYVFLVQAGYGFSVAGTRSFIGQRFQFPAGTDVQIVTAPDIIPGQPDRICCQRVAVKKTGLGEKITIQPVSIDHLRVGDIIYRGDVQTATGQELNTRFVSLFDKCKLPGGKYQPACVGQVYCEDYADPSGTQTEVTYVGMGDECPGYATYDERWY